MHPMQCRELLSVMSQAPFAKPSACDTVIATFLSTLLAGNRSSAVSAVELFLNFAEDCVIYTSLFSTSLTSKDISHPTANLTPSFACCRILLREGGQGHEFGRSVQEHSNGFYKSFGVETVFEFIVWILLLNSFKQLLFADSKISLQFLR